MKDSALTFSNLHITDQSKVMQFIKGLSVKEDKYELIKMKPKDLRECYNIVTNLRVAKVMTEKLQTGPT